MAKRKTPRRLHRSFVPCRDYIFVLLLLLGMASYLYGPRVPVMAAISVVTALACDALSALLMRRRFEWSDLSSYLFGLTYTVMLPASIGYSTVIFGTAVSVLLGKTAFGGYGHYPFHPSAFAFAFMSVCEPQAMFAYPRPFTPIGLGWESGAAVYPGISSALRLGGVPNVDRLDLLLGRYAGPLGTTFCLILLAGLVLLIARGTVAWRVPVVYLATCSVWALLFVRIQTGRLQSVMYEMLSGAVIFSAVFIISIPSIVPRHKPAQTVYGFVMGLAVMFYRTVGVYEMGVCFAVLLINPLAPYFDRVFSRSGVHRIRKGAKRRK